MVRGLQLCVYRSPICVFTLVGALLWRFIVEFYFEWPKRCSFFTRVLCGFIDITVKNSFFYMHLEPSLSLCHYCSFFPWLRLIKPYQNQKILEFKLPKYFGILLLRSLAGTQELQWSGNTAPQKLLCCCLHLIFCLAAHASLMSLITLLHSLYGPWSLCRSGFRAAVINQMLTRGGKAGF